MATRFKRTAVRKRSAAAKALASGKYRQRVVPNKKRSALRRIGPGEKAAMEQLYGEEQMRVWNWSEGPRWLVEK